MVLDIGVLSNDEKKNASVIDIVFQVAVVAYIKRVDHNIN